MKISKSLTGTTLLSGVMLLTACTTFASPASNSNAVKQTATNTVQSIPFNFSKSVMPRLSLIMTVPRF